MAERGRGEIPKFEVLPRETGKQTTSLEADDQRENFSPVVGDSVVPSENVQPSESLQARENLTTTKETNRSKLDYIEPPGDPVVLQDRLSWEDAEQIDV